ncbi:MAG: SDR family oxidoreductase [bacterium]
MDTFRDKVAIVTGGASGMGRAVCEGLGRRGARLVVVADVQAAGAGQVAAGIDRAGGKARAVGLDVSNEAELRKTIEQTFAEQGRLDYLFNNAGIGIAGEARDMLPEHWKRIIDVNLFGVLNGTLAAYPLMIRQGFGHIVNTASLAGLIPGPVEVGYALTKHAVVGLSTSLRMEAAPLGVRVSVVCPGIIDTPIFETSLLVGNVDRRELNRRIKSGFTAMNSEKAGKAILDGVEKNRAIIVFPGHARVLWWLHRISPSNLNFVARKFLEDFHKSRMPT